jgi:hypothetical protein
MSPSSVSARRSVARAQSAAAPACGHPGGVLLVECDRRGGAMLLAAAARAGVAGAMVAAALWPAAQSRPPG